MRANVFFILSFLLGFFWVNLGSADLPTDQQKAFDVWKKTTQTRLIDDGISPAVIDTYFIHTHYLSSVIQIDKKQPEKTLSLAEYMQRIITPTRIENASALLKKHQELFSNIEKKYGIPPHYLLALWGIETNFGKIQGDIPILSALATLSFDKRRSEFFYQQLLCLLKILAKNNLKEPRGSWAGAFGHFQFMPSTFYQYAVDEDKNGIIDIQNDLTDALGSAGNYLSKIGWNENLPWGEPVIFSDKILPDDKITSLMNEKHLLSFWQEKGVLPLYGKNFSPDKQKISATLILPEGIKGQAFLVYDNFYVIKKWNNSFFYALTVGVLADKIKGIPSLNVQNMKKQETPTHLQIKQLQEVFSQMGLYTGKIDGFNGKETKKAILKYQKQHHLVEDAFLSLDLWKKIIQQSEKI